MVGMKFVRCCYDDDPAACKMSEISWRDEISRCRANEGLLSSFEIFYYKSPAFLLELVAFRRLQKKNFQRFAHLRRFPRSHPLPLAALLIYGKTLKVINY